MPEIKNTFTQGKMNKDLDERIIPNGQYRHAENIQISTSDGADIGTVQNIMGNTAYTNAVGGGGGFKCVGSIADEKNNKLYWFVTSNNIDAILECSGENRVVPIIIDTKAKTSNAVLKFSDNIITSINIIDNVLLWTDNINEPRKINIDRCRSGNPIGFVSLVDISIKHTKLFVDGEIVHGNGINTYADMTWVRPGPGQGTNDITLFDVSRLQVGDKLDKFRTYTFLSDITIGSITPNSSSHAYPEGGVVGLIGSSTGTGITPPSINPNDRLTFSRELDIAEEHITVIKKKPLQGLNVKINPASGDNKKPLFETIFPRFSYRYKYVDGQYSPFGPFTDVVFNSMYPEDHDGFVYDHKSAYSVDEPYNSGMRNMIESIELSDFRDDTMPKDVVQIDILYKQENSSVIYVLENIKKDDTEWASNGSNPMSERGGKITIKSENIYAATPSNQLLRPWDNVPRKAMAQEVTGNRVVYGNYLQNYTNEIDPGLDLDYEVRYGSSITSETYDYENNLLYNGSFVLGTMGTAPGWTFDPNIQWINSTTQVRILNADPGAKLTQDNIPTLTVGETYRISLFAFVSQLNRKGSKLDGKLVDGQGNFIQFSGITHGNYVFEEELLDAGAAKLSASFHNSFFIQTTGNGSHKFRGAVRNIKVEKRVRTTNSKTFQDGGFPSIKSQRNYQLGIVYGDKYGRETPVFTSSDSSLVVPWESDDSSIGKTASQSLQLKAAITSPHPDWADYYKFFIKETSGEYYNLVMDAVYSPTKNDIKEESHLWISFASSDRNKISEDSYIILKKKGKDENQIQDENKYRVLDVKNEAPDAIKYKYLTLGQITNTFHPGILSNTDSSVGLFSDPHKSIIVTNSNSFPKEIHFKKSTWELYGGQPLTDIHFAGGTDTGMSQEPQDLYFSFVKEISEGNQESSQKYKIASLHLDSDTYKMRLAVDIAEIDSDMAESTTSGFIHPDITVRIERKVTKDLEAFSGRFFVKIISTNLTKDKLETTSDLIIVPNHSIVAKNWLRWLQDEQSATYNQSAGLINQQAFVDVSGGGISVREISAGLGGSSTTPAPLTHSGDNVTRTEPDWEAARLGAGYSGKHPFIDNMYAAATQLDWENHSARNSGQGWKGGIPSIPGDILHDVNKDGNALTVGNIPNGYTLYTHSSGDKITYPAINTMHLTNPGTTSDPGKYLINGIDGVITTDPMHVSSSQNDDQGLRRWRSSIHDENMTLDSTYGTEQGKHYIHISYMGPGKDLHDGNFPSGGMGIYPNAHTKEVLAGNLQAIWGGGVFTNEDGTPFPGTEENEAVFMEGTNTSSNNTGYHGYNDGDEFSPPYSWKHNIQWMENRPDGSDSLLHVTDFTSKLVAGKKFRFSDDSEGEVYTILSSTKKLLYNHTPWRKSYYWDGSAIVSTGDSVEDAVVAWANTRSSTDSGKAEVVGNQTKYDTMCDKIRDFGARNNRRVCYIIEVDKDITQSTTYNPVDGSQLDVNTFTQMQFIEEDFDTNSGAIIQNPAIWETEPKENLDIDIYHEASVAYPTSIDIQNKELVAPVGCEIRFIDNPNATRASNYGPLNVTEPIRLKEWTHPHRFTIDRNINKKYGDSVPLTIPYIGKRVRFIRDDGSYNSGIIAAANYAGATSTGLGSTVVDSIRIEPDLDPKIGLSWYNCFSFGNGVESNRIRDDFNAMVITNGVKANTTLDKKYEEERRKGGLIYSGIFNTTNGINNLNQFIAAEKITKDLSPIYGSIQKLFSRRVSLVAFCEDRVIAITANKSALYNADGNPQLIASDAVLGDANPFVGDYGISTNPESFAKESYRAYFTDRLRGAVLRLSKDGITPISDAGMHDYFRDNLRGAGNIIGSYDTHKKDYNLTLSEPPTVNVINNGFFDEGEDLVEYFNEQELTIDGSFSAGTNVYSSVLGYENTNLNDNPELDSGTKITNWPAINVGDIQAYQAEVVGTGGTTTTTNRQYSFSNTAASIYDWDYLGFYRNIPQGGTSTNTYQGFNVFSKVVGTETGSTSPVMWEREDTNGLLVVGPTGGVSGNEQLFPNLKDHCNSVHVPVNTPNPARQVNNPWPSAVHPYNTTLGYNYSWYNLSNVSTLPTPWNTWVNGQNGYVAGATKTLANATPNPIQNLNANNARVYPKLQNLSNERVDPDVLAVFPNATNTTTFHSEAYKVTLKISVWADDTVNGPWADLTDDEDKATDWEIKIVGEDPDNLGVEWDIPNQYFDDFFATATYHNLWGSHPNYSGAAHTTDTHDHTSVANNSFDHKLGWLTSNTRNLNNMGPGDHDIEFYFMLADDTTITSGSSAQILGPITNFINVKVGIIDPNSPVTLSYKNFKVEKLRRCTHPGGTTTTTTASAAGTPEIPAIPSGTDAAFPPVTAWAEVENTAATDWSIVGSGITSSVSSYGPNTGSPQVVNYTLADGITTGTYEVGANGTITYDQYPGTSFTPTSLLHSYAGFTLPTEVTHPSGGMIDINTGGTSWASDHSYIAQNNSNVFQSVFSTTSRVIDRWYEVKLSGVTETGGNKGIFVMNAIDDSHSSYIAPPTWPALGITLPGHLGEVTGTVTNNIKFSDEGNGEWIARWQQKTNVNLDTLYIGFFDFVGSVDKIELFDITGEEIGGGNLAAWSLGRKYENVNGVMQPVVVHHKRSPGRTLYYENSKVVWNNGAHGNWLAQSFSTIGGAGVFNTALEARAKDIGSSPLVTHDGYELRFTTSDVTSGELRGYIMGASDAVTLGEAVGIDFDSIDQDGHWSIKFNMDGTTQHVARYATSDYIGSPVSSSVSAVTTRQEPNTSGQWGRMNKIVFYVPDGGDFSGKIDNVSLKDATNYFIPSSSENWVFSGFDQTVENYISWNDTNKNVVFDNAPIGASLWQNIPNETMVNSDFHPEAGVNLEFDLSNYSGGGSISGYFYNTRGYGFTFGDVDSNQSFSEGFTLGDSITTNPAILRNTLVIEVDDGPFTGTLDNFKLYRYHPGFAPATITYSEDVKGWTSFKSFLPEAGVSLSGNYYTIKNGELWKHHTNKIRNWFYGTLVDPDEDPDSGDEYLDPPPALSTITAILNTEPSLIKTFNTLNYEGSQSKVYEYSDVNGITDMAPHNMTSKDGWYIDSISTDKQAGSVREFIEKEGKWFNYIKGKDEIFATDIRTSKPNTGRLTSQFSFQGLGVVSDVQDVAAASAPAGGAGAGAGAGGGSGY